MEYSSAEWGGIETTIKTGEGGAIAYASLTDAFCQRERARFLVFQYPFYKSFLTALGVTHNQLPGNGCAVSVCRPNPTFLSSFGMDNVSKHSSASWVTANRIVHLKAQLNDF